VEFLILILAGGGCEWTAGPFLALDHSGVATLGNLLRLGVGRARRRGFGPVTEFGAPFGEPGGRRRLTKPVPAKFVLAS
jgi:hypothetical protein